MSKSENAGFSALSWVSAVGCALMLGAFLSSYGWGFWSRLPILMAIFVVPAITTICNRRRGRQR